MASAMTLVIIGGGFDLSVGGMFGVASVSSRGSRSMSTAAGARDRALRRPGARPDQRRHHHLFRIHSFLATLADQSCFPRHRDPHHGGKLIPVRLDEFTGSAVPYRAGLFRGGRHDRVAAVLMVLLEPHHLRPKSVCRRGNEERRSCRASACGGSRSSPSPSPLRGGPRSAIAVSRISMGQPARAPHGIGGDRRHHHRGTSIYGGQGAIWRSIAGVIMLALVNNGFNI